MVFLIGLIVIGVYIIGYIVLLIKCIYMELGGKVLVIVFDDVDIDVVVDGVWIFGFYNVGQDCMVVCWIYVQQGIYDQLVEKFGVVVVSLKMGVLEDVVIELGLLSLLVYFECVSVVVEVVRVLLYIKVVIGGSWVDGVGYYFQLMLFVGVWQEDVIVQCEVFGLVVSVMFFSDEVQVLSWVNDF